MQYFKHTESGQVYGADKTTIPPVAYFEGRPTEFAKVAKPAPKAKGPKAPADSGQGDGDKTPKE